MRIVTTVCGDIPADELGFTSTHEHIIHDFTRVVRRFRNTLMPADFPQEKLELIPENFPFLKDCNTLFSEEAYLAEDLDIAAFEVEKYKELGGKSIVDAGALDIRGNVEIMKALAEATNTNIICSTGLYQYCSWPDELMDKDSDALCEVFLDEINHGIGGTGIRPGAIKAAVGGSASVPDETFERELTCVRAGAMAARESGLPLMVHTSGASATKKEDTLKVIDVALNEGGMAPDRLLMCHMDTWTVKDIPTNDYITNSTISRDADPFMALAVLERGVMIGFDTWGNPYLVPSLVCPDDIDRMRGLYQLLERGYADRIVFGNDFLCPKVGGVKVGGFGMTRAAGYAVPKLRELGLDDAEEQITVKNPARLFSREA